MTQVQEKVAYLGLRGKKLNRTIAMIAGIGFLLFGFDQGVLGGLLSLPEFLETFPRMHDSTIQGTVVSLYEVGCLLGAVATMRYGDQFGRRKVIFAGGIVMTIGATLQCTSFTLAQLIVGRVVTGVGNGFITSSTPLWQSEIAKPTQRGKLVMLEGALITGGIMISYWIDFGFFFVKGSANWRFPIAFQVVFALIIVAFVLRLPESPRWLIKKGRLEEARIIFSALDDVEVDDHLIDAQIEEIVATLVDETRGNAPIRRIFTFGREKHFHRAMLGFWNQAAQQLTGINLITFYSAFIYQNIIGLSPLNARILAACNGTEYFLVSFIAFYTIERIGRRKLMLFGAAGQCLTMALLTITVWEATTRNNSGAGIAAAILFFVFNTFFAIGWLGMTWLYPVEIVGLEIRASSVGMSTAANWSFNFMVVMITPVAFASISYHTYTVFAALNLLILICTYIFYPETAGRSLEEIDKIFEKSNPRTPWDVVKIAAELPHHNAILDEEERQHEKSQVRHVEVEVSSIDG